MVQLSVLESRAEPGRLFGKHLRISKAPPVTAQGAAHVARNHMQVEVKYRLPGFSTVELHQCDAVCLEDIPYRTRDFLSGANHSAGKLRIEFENVLRRTFREDERMALRLWHRIEYCDGPLILEELLCRQLAAQYSCENIVLVVGHGMLPRAVRVAQVLSGTVRASIRAWRGE